MKTLNRLRATITANFENFVSQVENQQAIVDQLTHEVKQALAEVQIKIKETKHYVCHKEKRIKQIESEIEKWQSFYKDLSQQEPEQAKKCIKRILFLKDELKQANQAIVEMDQSLEALNKEKYLIEDKLREIHTRKSSLIAKESHLKASQIAHETHLHHELEDIFNRWENKLIKVETISGSRPYTSPACKDELESLLDEREMEKRIQQEIENLK